LPPSHWVVWRLGGQTCIAEDEVNASSVWARRKLR
jgi:hypothetical protein